MCRFPVADNDNTTPTPARTTTAALLETAREVRTARGLGAKATPLKAWAPIAEATTFGATERPACVCIYVDGMRNSADQEYAEPTLGTTQAVLVAVREATFLAKAVAISDDRSIRVSSHPEPSKFHTHVACYLTPRVSNYTLSQLI